MPLAIAAFLLVVGFLAKWLARSALLTRMSQQQYLLWGRWDPILRRHDSGWAQRRNVRLLTITAWLSWGGTAIAIIVFITRAFR
jgi:hypothetical protein